jgi:hypothetical protein
VAGKMDLVLDGSDSSKWPGGSEGSTVVTWPGGAGVLLEEK